MNWYIGQQIACIKSHPMGLVKEGTLYRIFSLRQKECGCSGVQIDVGIKRPDRVGNGIFRTVCEGCGHKKYDGSDDTAWLHESRFAPLMDISELESILKEETINK